MQSDERGIASAALALMPMHLLVDPAGQIVSAGSTMRSIIGDQARFDLALEPLQPRAFKDLDTADHVILRLRDHPEQSLRGRAIRTSGDFTLFNLGFGIGVVEAIRRFDLTDQDFAPNELVMELLFLHEANAAMTEELSRANIRLEEARSKAEAEAFTDPLTGLYNRRGLDIAFAAVRQAAAIDSSQQFALAVIDLDRFKELNDTRGHAAGDEMLKIVSKRLRNITRDQDTLARIGGDEFVLIVPQLTDPKQLRALGERIIECIETPVDIMGEHCQISASIGATLSTAFHEISWEGMEAAADQALYSAKRGGRGTLKIAGDAGGI